ncbi:MAG: leucine--tRNA ligase [Patescibacteria group bacterium]
MAQEHYDHKKVEQKWQDIWYGSGAFTVSAVPGKAKAYILDMFPYPSGDGLHVGHPEGYTASDIFSRYLRMQGKQVLHPMGWDAFGLPAENYAIKTGTHPTVTLKKNIANFKRQIQSLGFSYDWSREVNTTDPEYYKWTQWIFLKLFEHGLAYEAEAPINWCPKDKTGLANEEVVGGKCDRCGTVVEKKNIRQWLVKITDAKYIERLLNDLDQLDWPESIKQSQRNWIGKSEGAEVQFVIASNPAVNSKDKIAPACLAQASAAGRSSSRNSGSPRNDNIKVFTTRPDTLFGATYMVLSPEHALVSQITTDEQRKAVEKYQKHASQKSDLERTELAKEKTGVFTGAYAINPVNNEKIPVWIADYVLVSYGTGAIMAVPAHDERDHAFAKKFKLPVKKVIEPPKVMPRNALEPVASPGAWGHLGSDIESECWTGEGIMVTPPAAPPLQGGEGEREGTYDGPYEGLTSQEFRKAIVGWLEKTGNGKAATNYKLRDWVFSRQRYWGEPIPMVHCPKDGIVGVPEEQLPVVLPDVEKYEPTGTGESPLAGIKSWVNTTCPKCGGPAKRETNTMPQWAGSNWYFLRYCDPHNAKQLADPEKLKAWLPVDTYIGGAEHAVLHLLYARFIYKFLHDIEVVPKSLPDEPFTKLINQGLILAEDGQKMSKSRGNVITPDLIVREYGADSLRMFEMFMGPLEDAKPWSTRGIVGVRRFLEKVWQLQDKVTPGDTLHRETHALVKHIGEDIASFSLNTAVSNFMKWVNAATTWESVSKKEFVIFITLLSPFAPHLAQELWVQLGHKDQVHDQEWPSFDASKVVAENVEVVVQINGKVRDKFTVASGTRAEDLQAKALASEKIQHWLDGKTPKKIIVVKGKLVSIVV